MKFYSFLIFLFSFSVSFSQIKMKTNILEEKIEIFQLKENSIKVNHYAKKQIYSTENNINAYFYEQYQEKNKIKIKYIKIYDRFGRLLKNVNKTEIYHTNASPNNTLYSDIFQSVYELKRPELPYIIEYEFECVFDDILNFPEWIPQYSSTTIDKSTYIIHALPETKVKYKYYNFEPEYSILKSEKEIIYTWSYSNESLVENDESFYYEKFYGLPKMIVNANHFLMNDVKGDFRSWSNFGNFYYHLNKERKELPENLKTKLDYFKSEAKDDLDLLSLVYTYLQESKRYIFINLDLSGYQSMTVNEIDEKSYGDCKALTNYLESSLNYVGIESYSALIKGKRDVFHFENDFVCNQFNHVICCSIIDNDTFWLESTSNKEPINFLSNFTSDRPALIIKKDESKLVQTPSYLNDFNFSDIEVKAIVKENSDATLFYTMNLNGLNQNMFRSYLDKATKKDMNDFLMYYFEYLEDFELKDYKIVTIDHTSPHVKIEVEIYKPNFYQKIGKNFLVNLNIFSPLKEIPKINPSDRKTNFFYPYGIKENFNLKLDFEKISEVPLEVVEIEKIIDSDEIKAKYYIKKQKDKKLSFSLEYNINTFQEKPDNLEGIADNFYTLNSFFDTKLIVKSTTE